jgi:hypothetical protein
MKNWFTKFAFKFNVCRYHTTQAREVPIHVQVRVAEQGVVRVVRRGGGGGGGPVHITAKRGAVGGAVTI